jgi:hypothetical protein
LITYGHAQCSERNALLAALEKEEAWMYENGDEATTETFVSRLNGLRTLYDKINNRLLEVEARRIASEKASSQVDVYLNVANSTSEGYSHLSDDERNKMRQG